MTGPVLGFIVGTVAVVGVGATLAVLSSVYRESTCVMRAVVIGAAVALFGKACIAFTHPHWIDVFDALLILGLTGIFVRRLVKDHDGGTFLDFMGK